MFCEGPSLLSQFAPYFLGSWDGMVFCALIALGLIAEAGHDYEEKFYHCIFILYRNGNIVEQWIMLVERK